jgi:hypothetical protein
MDSSKLTTEQAARLSKSLYPHLNYLCRMRRRMELIGFPPGDPLFLLVSRAYDSLQQLSVEVHYMSCGSGVGKPSSERQK